MPAFVRRDTDVQVPDEHADHERRIGRRGVGPNALAAWRACSNFAQGRTWATVFVLDREERLLGSSFAKVLLKVTNSLDRVFGPLGRE